MNNLRLTWNNASSCWVVDIKDESGNALISGIPLVTGADLLEQFGYVGIGGQLIVQTDQSPDDVPTFENLGSIGHMYYLTP